MFFKLGDELSRAGDGGEMPGDSFRGGWLFENRSCFPNERSELLELTVVARRHAGEEAVELPIAQCRDAFHLILVSARSLQKVAPSVETAPLIASSPRR